jgi:hypothetical protein
MYVTLRPSAIVFSLSSPILFSALAGGTAAAFKARSAHNATLCHTQHTAHTIQPEQLQCGVHLEAFRGRLAALVAYSILSIRSTRFTTAVTLRFISFNLQSLSVHIASDTY